MHRIAEVSAADPIGSYLKDLHGACALFHPRDDQPPDSEERKAARLAEAAECLRNVRNKFLPLEIPAERMGEVVAKLAVEHKHAAGGSKDTATELLHHVAAMNPPKDINGFVLWVLAYQYKHPCEDDVQEAALQALYWFAESYIADLEESKRPEAIAA